MMSTEFRRIVDFTESEDQAGRMSSRLEIARVRADSLRMEREEELTNHSVQSASRWVRSSSGVSTSASKKRGQDEEKTEQRSPLLSGNTDEDDSEDEERLHLLGPSSPEWAKSFDPSSTQYDDFHTIDWINDRQRDRLRHKRLKRSRRESWTGCFHQLHDAWSGWLVVFFVGVAAGVAAGFIDIGASWMGDLKEGVCSYGYWLDKAACCFPSNDTLFNIDHCSEWKEWSQLLHVDGDNTSYAVNYILYLAIAVAFAALSAVLVKVFAPYACGSGIPEVKTILSGFVIRGYLGAWTLLIKALTMMTAVAAGLSLGKEGPLVHVACCCGNIFSRLFPKYRKNEAKKREVLSAAAAAGVSVAFGAPIGGVLFSLEEVSYYFPHKVLWRSFFSALTAMLVLTYMNPYFTGKLVLFYANYDGPWNIAELICFIFLGILGGLYGAIFIKINLKWSKLRKTSKLGKHAVLEVIVIAVITSVIAYISPFTRGGASATIGRLFRQCEPADVGDPLCDYAIQLENQHDSYVFGLANSELWKCVWELALACIFKGIITIFTFGIKVPAGLFIPSMYVGACFGRIFGILVQQLVFSNRTHPLFKQMCEATPGCVIPGLYAMVGAAASLGGVTRMTVSLVVIMFELTGGLTYIIPLMVAIVTSKWVGDAFGRDGIYDGHIHLNGYPFMDSKREFKHTTLAADVMRPRPRCNEPPLQTIPATSATVGDIEHLLDETDYFGFPVVLSEDSQLLAGYVNSSEIARALAHARSADTQITSESVVYFTRDIPRHLELEQSHPVSLNLWLDKSPFCIIDQTPIDTVIEIFRKMGLRHTLVTHNGRLLGIITKKDLLRHIAQMTNMDPESILFH